MYTRYYRSNATIVRALFRYYDADDSSWPRISLRLRVEIVTSPAFRTHLEYDDDEYKNYRPRVIILKKNTNPLETT